MDAAKIRARVARVRSSFTPGQMAIVGALSVVAIVGTIGFLRWASQPSYRPLLTNGTQDEVRSAVDSLDKAKISYKLSSDGTTVLVHSGDLGKARLSLDPTSPAGTKIVGLELFDQQSFTSSDFQQRVGYQRALQGELTRAILKIDGIQSATVQLAMPTERLFQKDQQATRASVLVGSTKTLTSDTVQSIVGLVSSAVPGLDPANVTVTDTRGRVLTKAGATTGDDRTTLTENTELQLAAKAESMLAQVYGPGRVVVRVAAQMNFDKRDVETTTYQPQTVTPVRSSETNESFKGSGSPPSGTIGVEGSVGSTNTSGTNEYTRTEKATESVMSSTVEKSSRAPGAIERLTAAAVVDSSLDPQPDPNQVKQLIEAAIGASADRGDSVVVQAQQFGSGQGADAVQTKAAAGAAGSSSPLTNYVSMGVGVLLLILVALFLRRGLRTTTETIDLTDAAVAARGEAGEGAGAEGERLPSELRLIDSEPDELASLLRSWVADRREVPRA